MAKQILCGFGVDIDAVAGWLGSYGGEDSPSDIQRGMFAGEVGVPRLLKLFDKLKTVKNESDTDIKFYPQGINDIEVTVGFSGVTLTVKVSGS